MHLVYTLSYKRCCTFGGCMRSSAPCPAKGGAMYLKLTNIRSKKKLNIDEISID